MKSRKYIFILMPIILIGLVSCNNKPIFSVIENEIYLKKFSIEGNVLGLIEKGNKVYAANRAGVYEKTKDSGSGWQAILTAGIGVQNIASNSENIFACFESGKVKYYDESNKVWQDVPNTENIRVIYGNTNVFGYDESKNKIYKITKDNIEEVVDASNLLISAAGDYFLISSRPKTDNAEAVPAKLYQNNTLKENLPENAKHLCSADGNNIFVLAGSTIYYYNGTNWDAKKEISGKKPLYISYFSQRKTILVGCQNGYTEIKWDADTIDISNARQVNPGDSDSTTPPASYLQYQTTLENYYSSPILGVELDAPESGKYAVFIGISSGTIQRNTGLWGFYSDKKREWNRE